ncbi:MAG: MFS transporter, partial [Solirubrobacterales bacterium]|nr:MFS transporter [Solirubrobacterales bacterium]
MAERGERRRGLLSVAVCAAVAVAFADSSIVVLALPSLYASLRTSIVGVSWVITSYNLVVAVGAFLLLAVIRRLRVARLTQGGLALFAVGSAGCAASGTLVTLIVFRCVQGAGAAMLLAGTLPLLAALRGSRPQGVALWVAAGTLGAALGPALGGLLTQLFSWRAIFVLQAPVALVALVAAFESHLQPSAEHRRRIYVAANVGLGLVFGALVGALFLAVLMVISVWGLSPLAGAATVSALPLAAVLVRSVSGGLSGWSTAGAGATLLAGGLVALALLPATSIPIVVVALALCGAGMGLVVPILTHAAVPGDEGLVSEGTMSIGARHAGLVVALVLVAPLLSHDLDRGGQDALLSGAKVLLSADLPLRQQVPIALDLGRTLDRTPRGTVPDLAKPFDARGAAHDPRLAATRDSLVGAIKDALTRSFRRA